MCPWGRVGQSSGLLKLSLCPRWDSCLLHLLKGARGAFGMFLLADTG